MTANIIRHGTAFNRSIKARGDLTGRVYSGEFFLARRLRLFYLKFEKIGLEVLVSLRSGRADIYFAIDNKQNLSPAMKMGNMGD